MKTRSLFRLLLAVAVVAVGAAAVRRALAPVPVPVRVESVERGVVRSTVTNTKAGTVKAVRRARLAPEVGGRVVEAPHREGDTVPAGTLLVRLDDGTPRAERVLAERALEVARADHARACIEAERARRELSRKRRLFEESIASVEEVDVAESAHDVAISLCVLGEAEIARAEARVDVARAELEKYRVLAPFDGTIAELEAEVGEWITPSPPGVPMPTVIDFVDRTANDVHAPMDEVDSARLSVGMTALVTVDSHPNETFLGRVTRVAPYVSVVEEQNRTVEIEVALEDEGLARSLLPGTSADVEVVLEERVDALRIPAHARLEGAAVLVLAGDRLERRAVETGLENWQWIEVTGGLVDGERVVVSLDREGVEEGALARAEAEAASASGSAP